MLVIGQARLDPILRFPLVHYFCIDSWRCISSLGLVIAPEALPL